MTVLAAKLVLVLRVSGLKANSRCQGAIDGSRTLSVSSAWPAIPL